MPDRTTTSVDPATSVGSISAAISNAVVGLLHDYTGRGPTHARTTVGNDTIVVTLRNSLTKAERTLAGCGQALEVLAMRRAFQNTMRGDLIGAVERITGRTVEAFLSDNLHEPDVAVEIFLLRPLDADTDADADADAVGNGNGNGARTA
ncbi:MAG: hypothetical protein QOE31_768 [Solirubrobacteraceae bacterium]|nr:hypothetical protein [Solirubrobacteraceae bacterium]